MNETDLYPYIFESLSGVGPLLVQQLELLLQDLYLGPKPQRGRAMRKIFSTNGILYANLYAKIPNKILQIKFSDK